jgi:hypothetical protein
MKLTKEDEFNMRVADTLNSKHEFYELAEKEGSGYNFTDYIKDRLVPIYKGMKQRNEKVPESEQMYELTDVHGIILDYFNHRLGHLENLNPDKIKDMVDSVLDAKAGILSGTIDEALETDKKKIIAQLALNYFGVNKCLNDIAELRKKADQNVFAGVYNQVKKLNGIKSYLDKYDTVKITDTKNIDSLLLEQAEQFYEMIAEAPDEEMLLNGVVPEQFKNEFDGLLGQIMKTYGREDLLKKFSERIEKCGRYAKEVIYPEQDRLHEEAMESAGKYIASIEKGNESETAKEKLNYDINRYADFSLKFGNVLEESRETIDKFFAGIEKSVENAKKSQKFADLEQKIDTNKLHSFEFNPIFEKFDHHNIFKR